VVGAGVGGRGEDGGLVGVEEDAILGSEELDGADEPGEVGVEDEIESVVDIVVGCRYGAAAVVAGVMGGQAAAGA
jgi:hypothetical protein